MTMIRDLHGFVSIQREH